MSVNKKHYMNDKSTYALLSRRRKCQAPAFLGAHGTRRGSVMHFTVPRTLPWSFGT